MRTRGSVQRSQTTTLQRTIALMAKTTTETAFQNHHMAAGRMPVPRMASIASALRPGTCQPPRKSVVAMAERTQMLPHSTMKKMAKRKPEYSELYPDTSSDSASGRSNGVRFASASWLMKRMKKATNAAGFRKMNHSQGSPPCARMMPCIDSVPAIAMGTKIATPAGISYEMTCAADRMPPKSAHLELDDQPESSSPTTTSAVMLVT